MAKQLNVNLAFTADTKMARQELQNLQTQLNNISKLPSNVNLPLNSQLKEAAIAAMELKTHLTNATNIQTGTLDFSKLNQSIKNSGVTLSEYGRRLQAIGPDGQKAFMSLAQSVSQAEIPIRRSHQLLTNMATTLKNTARWQISSSVLHGFMGAVSSAYRYAQDLNESLNNIRIVTSASTEEMARFAEQANRAAKALHTTTTEYTNASLIYFQQGLDANEVEKRTAITIKMANAAGQSAQIVSDQLTAVWNNFYDGSKSLEYYADVMTALGAATASSTDEIAGGLEKFAAIADTIGLSYEYAASALATITSNTRQSEEVVGTALKTIFARIQGLNLGETLEDGVTLNKYSEALQKIGISIFEQNGELKDMDSILDEMGSRWESLNKAQQVAVAQTVAGIRQYNQLISLMDNWNDGDSDSMRANLNTAYGSSGTLEEQADIYAESWEAARDRVTAAAEAIYASLLDDEFFIDLFNGLENVLSGVDQVIDSMGGLRGVLSTIGVIATRVFSEQISQGLRNMVYNLQMSTAAGRNYIKQQKVTELQAMGNDLALGSAGEGSEVGVAMRRQYTEQIQLQAELAVRQDQMNDSELSHIQQIMDMRKNLGDQVIAAVEKETAAKDHLYDMQMQAIAEMGRVADRDSDGILHPDTLRDFDALKGRLKGVEVSTVNLKAAQDKYNAAVAAGSGAGKAFSKLEHAIRAAGKQLNMTDQDVDELLNGIKADASSASTEVDRLMKLLSGRSGHLQGRMSQEFGVSTTTAKNIAQGYRDIATAAREKSAAEAQADKVQALALQRMKQAKGAISDWATGITSAASAVFSFVSVLNSAKGAIDALTNPDLSGWEKFTTVLSSAAMVVMMIISMAGSLVSAIEGLRKVQITTTLATITNAAAEWLDAEATKDNAKAKMKKAAATDASSKETREDTAENLTHAASEEIDKKATEKNVESKKKLGDAFKRLGESAKKWVVNHKSFLGGIALITAGIAVAVGGIAWGISQYNRFEAAAEAAGKRAEEAAMAYQSVADTYNQFTSNLSAYEDAQSGLENLTVGTLEYQEAILKANESAMELLNTYEDLTYTTNAHGLIVIDKTSLDAVREQQLQQLKNAQLSSQLANQVAKNAELQVESVKLQRESLRSSQGSWTSVGNAAAATGVGAASGALIGTGIGMLGGPIGAAIGAGLGAIAGAITGVVGTIASGSAAAEEQEALTRLAEIYTKEGNAAFATKESFESLLRNKLKIEDEALIKSLVANKDATLDLVKEMSAADVAQKNLNTNLIIDKYQDYFEKAGVSEENLLKVGGLSAAALEKLVDDLYESEYKDQFAGLTDAEIQRQYADAMGWGSVKNLNGNKGTYYKKDGTEIGTIDDDVARRYLATQSALKKLEPSIKNVTDAFTRLYASTDHVDQLLAEFLTSQDFSNFTLADFESLIAAVGGDDGVVNQEEAANYLGSKLGGADGVLSNEEAAQYGYDSAEAFILAFYENFTTFTKDFEMADDSFTELTQSLIAAYVDTANLSANDIKKIGSKIETSIALVGEEAGEYLANTIFAGAGKSAGELANLFDQIDWNTIDVSELQKLLKENNIVLNVTENELTHLINIMNTDLILSIEDAAAKIAALSKLKAMQQGDLIDSEKYAQLDDYLQSFFTRMSDGTYKLTADALDFYQAVQNQIVNIGQTVLNQGQAQRSIEDQIKEKDWSYYKQGFKADTSTPTTVTTLSPTGEPKTYSSYEEYQTDWRTAGKPEGAYGNGPVHSTTEYDYISGTTKVVDTWQVGRSTLNARYPEVSYDTKETYDKNAQMEQMWQNYANFTTYLKEQGGKEILSDQLLLLQQTAWGKTDEGATQLLQWQEKLTKETLNLAEATEIYNKVLSEGESYYNSIEGSIEETNKKIREGYQILFESAETAQERESILNDSSNTQTDEQKRLKNEAYLQSAHAAIQQEASEGLDVEEWDAYAEHLQEVFNIAEEESEDVAAAVLKMNRGVETLQSNWEDWGVILKKSSKSSHEYAKAATETKKALSDILDVSEDFISLDFITQESNLELIGKAAEGDAEAIDALGSALARTIAETAVNNLEITEAFTLEQKNAKLAEIQSMMDEVNNLLSSGTVKLDLGQALTGEDELFNKLTKIVETSAMSVEEANAFYRTLGFTPKFKTTPITAETKIPLTTTVHKRTYPDPNDENYWVEEEYSTTVEKEAGEHIVNALSMGVETGDGQSVEVPTAEVEKLTYTGGGSLNNYSSDNPGGGNTKSPAENKKNLTKKTDVVERYKELDDALDDVADAMADVNKQADRLYGANRIKALQKQNELLLKQRDLLKQKKSAAETDLEADKNSLITTAQTYGVNFEFDANGNISNYTAEMTKLYEELATQQAYWANATNFADAEKQEEWREANVQPIQDKIDELKALIGIYTDTRELIEDLDNEIDDKFYEWQDNNYEQIHYKLELELEINDTELRMIDYYLNKIADDFYSMGEAAAKISTEKVDTLVNTLQDYESFENDLHAKFKAGDISQEKYVEGLKETFNGYLDNLEALQELDKEMQHYYEDTLSAGAEELAIYTDHMEHLTSVLDHYQNIVTMMNGEVDFDNIGTILEGKATTLNNEMKVAESNYAMLKAEQVEMQAAYDAADEEGKKYLKSSLDAINAQVDEAHETMLSKTEEWAEAQRAIMENSMKKAAHEMEMAFTNNMGFDALNSSMDRLSSYSNEYLTKTNQIYETQKLMNTAQQAIDKTTNQAAKVRLENYNKEIRQLQEKNKLSNLELDIAKAKYDVLLAEIALEEAQNAKATVRLQRDSEGNYGYVYTADKENIAKAEQDLADAQNALYNIGLEGANDYGSKLLDLQQQLADELIALEEARAAGQYKTDEEYYAAKERLISEYNNLFEAYSAQYTTALEVDTAIQQEAWVNAYDEMILKTEDWQIHVDEYTILCEESYSHWREIVQAESDIVTDLLGNVSDAVKNVTDESNNLKDKIVKEVIPAIENEYAQVRTAVLAYESLRAGLQLTIQRYEELAAAIQETMRQQALLEGQANTPEVPDIPEEFSPEEPDNKIGHSEMMDLVEDIMVHGSYENDPERTQKILDAGYTAADRATAQQIINDIARNESAAWRTGKDWDKVLNEYTTKYGYNTGGYTGEWGPEGRLAVLHQKELILNASDTQNFLMATEILRSIADIIDINSLHSQMSQLTPVGMTTSGQQILEQAVSIEAHFPNVTDRNEIEEAFNNLINTASQYANRKF